jgi:hypothetical protein
VRFLLIASSIPRDAGGGERMMAGRILLASQTSQFGGSANRRFHGVLAVESNTVRNGLKLTLGVGCEQHEKQQMERSSEHRPHRLR